MDREISGLLFDLGGVVVDIDFDEAFRGWAEISQLSAAQIRGRFAMDDAYRRHERGEMGAAAYFAHLRQRLELTGSDEDIARGWNAIFRGEIGETVDRILSVRERLPCYAFTNSNPTHQTAWSGAYPRMLTAFHRIFISSEMGLRKPEPGAFQAVAHATGIAPEAMLFFDDTEENVAGARAVGMRSVRVRKPADVARALSEVGVL